MTFEACAASQFVHFWLRLCIARMSYYHMHHLLSIQTSTTGLKIIHCNPVHSTTAHAQIPFSIVL